jgi:GT2 family glycosyltransferase
MRDTDGVTSGNGRIAALVLAHDRPAVTRTTITALLAQDPMPDVLMLVDNAGTPELSAALAEGALGHPDARVLRLDSNRGCAGGYQAGLDALLERDDIEYICCFDDDATPQPGCLAALIDAARMLPDVGQVGAVAHDATGTLAWPISVEGEAAPLRTVEDVRALAARLPAIPVANLAWQGLLLPVEVLRRVGTVWGELYFQYEDIELGLRLRRAGLRCYMIPGAQCLHPAPPPARELRIAGRRLTITRQAPAREYLSLRNGLVVWHRYDGLQFWYGSGVFVLLRGLLTALNLEMPRRRALHEVFVAGILDAIRGRLGPAPARLGTWRKP